MSNAEQGERSCTIGRTINVAEAALKKHQALRILRIKSKGKAEGKKRASLDKQWGSREINPESVVSKTAHFFCRYFRNDARKISERG